MAFLPSNFVKSRLFVLSRSTIRRGYTTNSRQIPGWEHPLHVSDTIRDRKSVFLAHASVIGSHLEVESFLAHLTHLRELKGATHCMYAFTSAGRSGQSDGREAGSGDRLARLLRLTGCCDTILVVSRWYGGIQLGSDRWKHISHVAKGALAKGSFMKERVKVPAVVKPSKKGKKKNS